MTPMLSGIRDMETEAVDTTSRHRRGRSSCAFASSPSVLVVPSQSPSFPSCHVFERVKLHAREPMCESYDSHGTQAGDTSVEGINTRRG